MADRMSKEARSRVMSRIRKTDTKPELRVRSLLHWMGYRFRLHRRDLPGTPDIVLPKHRAVIFVHGCFWHQHPGCKLAKVPKSRLDYWGPKLRRNVERHERAVSELTARGWRTLTIWECETQQHPRLEQRLRTFLEAPPQGNSNEAV